MKRIVHKYIKVHHFVTNRKTCDPNRMTRLKIVAYSYCAYHISRIKICVNTRRSIIYLEVMNKS